jgi:cytidylate kinase
MFSDRDVTKVISLVDQASVVGRTILVAVDGLMGAGKSTLTAQTQGMGGGRCLSVKHISRAFYGLNTVEGQSA